MLHALYVTIDKHGCAHCIKEQYRFTSPDSNKNRKDKKAIKAN